MNTNERTPPPFAQQRLICFALLLGMVSYATVVAVMLLQNNFQGMATEYIGWLDIAVPATGLCCAVLAWTMKRHLSAAAASLFGVARGNARFRANFIPIAIAEGGCLFGFTAWLLNANWPPLVTALVLLSISIWFMPMRDPDAGT
jgi:hypothetical protein